MRFRYPDEWRQRQAFAALEQKDIEKAENIIFTLRPNRFSSNYHALVGTLLSLKGRHEEAIDEIDKALQLRPYAANLYLQKAMILRKLARPVEALESLRQGFRYNKNYSGVLEGIATMSMETNQPDSCILYAKRLGSVEPSNPIVFFLLTKAYAVKGDMEQAGKYAEIYRTRGAGQPSFETNWQKLSEILVGTESKPDER
jgi:tetratricopeptide (TPR) repeat protein